MTKDDKDQAVSDLSTAFSDHTLHDHPSLTVPVFVCVCAMVGECLLKVGRAAVGVSRTDVLPAPSCRLVLY